MAGATSSTSSSSLAEASGSMPMIVEPSIRPMRCVMAVATRS